MSINLYFVPSWCGTGPWKRTPIWAWKSRSQTKSGFTIRVLWFGLNVLWKDKKKAKEYYSKMRV